MNPSRATLLKVTAIALVAAAGSIAAVACDSGSSNGTNTPIEGGGDDGNSSGASSSSSGASSSSSGASSSSSSGASSSSSGASSSSSSGGDAGDGGSACVKDASPNCNSCATIATDPLNTCSQFGVNCSPFNNAEAGVPSPLPTN